MWRNRQVAFIDYNKTEYTDLHLARLISDFSELRLIKQEIVEYANALHAYNIGSYCGAKYT